MLVVGNFLMYVAKEWTGAYSRRHTSPVREDTQMKTIKLAAVLIAVALFVTMMSGCGGSGDSPVAPPAPHQFSPTVHNGYAVYLIGPQYDASYLPQNAADSFSVAPGCYKPACLRADQIGTAQMHTAGSIDWQSSFTDNNSNTVSPTPSGWVLGPGTYTGVTPNPSGGSITFTVNVVADTLNGLKVRMIPVDAEGNRYEPTGGAYNIPIWEPSGWVQEWTRNGAVVTQTRYSAYANTVAGSENITWEENLWAGKVSGMTTFVVYVYDNQNPGGMEGGGSAVTVDTVTINFTYQQ